MTQRVPVAILLTGLPAAGKTSVGIPLAASIGLPILRADTIKESIFDTVGYGTLRWSEFLTTVSTEVALRLLPQVGPCIIDVFMPLDMAQVRLSAIIEQIVEVHCSLPYEVAWQRFVARARGGGRHPGHLDADVPLEFYRSTLEPQRVDRPYRLGEAVLEVDTSTPVDHDLVAKWVANKVRDQGWPRIG